MACNKGFRILAVIISLFVVLFSACGSEEPENPQQEEHGGEYALNHTELSLFLDETCDLTVLNNENNEQVLFGSTNVRSVTVTPEGKITAIAIGYATVYAEVGGKTLTCAVTVSIKEEGVPFIDLINERKTDAGYVFNLPVGDEYELNPVLIDGRAVDGVQFGITSDNDKVVVSGMKIKALESVNSVSVRITCKYENKDYELSVKVNAVEVGE